MSWPPINSIKISPKILFHTETHYTEEDNCDVIVRNRLIVPLLEYFGVRPLIDVISLVPQLQ